MYERDIVLIEIWSSHTQFESSSIDFCFGENLTKFFSFVQDRYRRRLEEIRGWFGQQTVPVLYPDSEKSGAIKIDLKSLSRMDQTKESGLCSRESCVAF